MSWYKRGFAIALDRPLSSIGSYLIDPAGNHYSSEEASRNHNLLPEDLVARGWALVSQDNGKFSIRLSQSATGSQKHRLVSLIEESLHGKKLNAIVRSGGFVQRVTSMKDMHAALDGQPV